LYEGSPSGEFQDGEAKEGYIHHPALRIFQIHVKYAQISAAEINEFLLPINNRADAPVLWSCLLLQDNHKSAHDHHSYNESFNRMHGYSNVSCHGLVKVHGKSANTAFPGG